MTSDQVSPGPSGYGTLGVNVGRIGHWARLLFGALLLLFVALNLMPRLGLAPESVGWLARFLLALAAIAIVYTAVYWFLGERGILPRLGPWTNTAIFVGPAFVVAWWNLLVAPFTGIGLPASFWLAMLAYIGLSFLLQWRLRYGGCEVVALPILLFRKRYPSYCIPLVAIDAVEKAIVDSRSQSGGG